MRNSLQRSEIVLRARGAAADQHHRHTLQLRVGNRGDAIGDAGTGRDHCDADGARQHGMRMRHVHGGPFVAHVDDAHPALTQLVPDRLDMPALQSEYAIDAAGEQEIDDQFSDGCCALSHREPP